MGASLDRNVVSVPVDSPTEIGDVELVSLLRADPDKGFPLLLERHGNIIHHLAGTFAKDPDDREDLIQEVILSLLEDGCRRLTIWQPKGAFSSYLYMVVWRLCVDFRSRIDRHNRISSEEREVGGQLGRPAYCGRRRLSTGGSDDHVGSGNATGVEPPVAARGVTESDLVVLAAVPADQYGGPVSRGDR